jgi:hypothetical protein
MLEEEWNEHRGVHRAVAHGIYVDPGLDAKPREFLPIDEVAPAGLDPDLPPDFIDPGQER